MFRSRAQTSPDLDESLELITDQASAAATVVDAATEAASHAGSDSTGHAASRRLDAARESLDALAPRVEAARAALAPHVVAARGALSPRIEAARDALDALAPRLDAARAALSPRMSAARESLAPRVETALEGLTPRLEAVVDSLGPRVEAALEAATHAGGPAAAQVRQRGAGALAALRGELPEPPKSAPRWRIAVTFLGIGLAAGTGVGILARKLTSPPPPPVSSTPPWQASTATSPTTRTASTGPAAAPPLAAPSATPHGEDASTVFDAPVPAMPTPVSTETVSGIEPDVTLLPDADGSSGPSDTDLQRP